MKQVAEKKKEIVESEKLKKEESEKVSASEVDTSIQEGESPKSESRD